MLHKKFDFYINLNECFIKDYELNKFCETFPKLNSLILEMKSCLNSDFKNYLVDLIVQDYKVGQKTCSDVRYHFDGDFNRDNQYCMWLCGENRTVFSKEIFTKDSTLLKGFTTDRNHQSETLESFLKEKPSFIIPEKTILVYDSLVPHKGVICKKSGKRVLVRLMGTNYIKPKNFIKR